MTPAALLILLALQALSASGNTEPASPPPHRLEEVRMPAPWLLAPGPGGVISGWDPRGRRAVQWNARGELLAHCQLEDPRLPHAPSFAFAGRPGRLLVSYFDFPAGSEQARQLVLLDLQRCRVERVVAVEGLVLNLTAASHGWLANLFKGSLFAPQQAFVRLGEDAKILEEFDVSGRAADILQELRLSAEHASFLGGRLLAVDREVWLLPDAAYELWRPARQGKPFRRLVPPPCLAASVRVLSPEESRQRTQERARLFPEPMRRAVEREAGGDRVAPILQRATRGVAVHRGLVAVQLTDPRVEGGARMDIWDVGREALLAVVPLPAAAGLLAMGDGFVWLTQEGEALRRLSLPPLEEPLADPCTAVTPALPLPASPHGEERSRGASDAPTEGGTPAVDAGAPPGPPTP